MARVIIALAAAAFLGVIGVQMYRLNEQRRTMETKVEATRKEVAALTAENEKITADLRYLSYPENLLKELKSLFNYRRSDEELHIIVPKGNGN